MPQAERVVAQKDEELQSVVAQKDEELALLRERLASFERKAEAEQPEA
jgi:hypothetical protein